MSESPKHYDIVACIVTYHSAVDDVARAVQSFAETAKEDGLNVHCIVVDNASETSYVTQLERAISPHAELRRARKNGGFGYGHNRGIQAAPASDYYLVLNPDVIIHRGTLAALKSYMDANASVGLSSPKILYENGDVQHLNKRAPTIVDLFARRFLPAALQNVPAIKQRMEHYMMLDVGYDSSYDVDYMTGCFMFFRTNILQRVGGFDEDFFMYLEDADITKRVNAISRAVYYADATVTHKWARGSHKNVKLMLVMFHSIYIYFKKWGVRWW